MVVPAVLFVAEVPAGRHGDDADANDGSCWESLDDDGLVAECGCPDVDTTDSVTVVLVLPALAGTQRGTNTYDSVLTVKWCASVASAFSVKKNKYCTIIGVRERKLDVAVADFSIRAQVRYTSKRRRRTPSRIIDRWSLLDIRIHPGINNSRQTGYHLYPAG